MEIPHFNTLAVHPTGQASFDPQTGAVIPTISLSTTFAQSEPAKPFGDFEYSRSDNPNRRLFEESVAALEGGKFGFAFASGSATTATILYSLGLGIDVISVDDVYGGTNRFLNQVAKKQGLFTVQMINTNNLENVTKSIKPETKLIWIETPTNPTLQITDIEAISRSVKATRPDIWIVVDNTFMSPCNQRPLTLGADIVVHSVTKYLNGHCDVVMGVAVTNSREIADKLKFMQIQSVPFRVLLIAGSP